MTVTKTGCHIWIEPYKLWARGDAHQYGSVFVFRLVDNDHDPFEDVMHYSVKDFEEWFDRSNSDRRKGCSTLVVRSIDVEDHGWEGQSITDEDDLWGVE